MRKLFLVLLAGAFTLATLANDAEAAKRRKRAKVVVQTAGATVVVR